MTLSVGFLHQGDGRVISEQLSHRLFILMTMRIDAGRTGFMDIDEVIRDQVRKTEPSGTYPFPDLIESIRSGGWSGIAVSKNGKGESYLLFIAGEPEGALFSDNQGVLAGDKAVFWMDPKSTYVFHQMAPDVVDRFVLWCRIFDKSHVKSGSSREVIQIGKKPMGIGVLVTVVERAGVPVPGAHLAIRREGHVIGNNLTDSGGKASFRLMFGPCDCAVTLKDHQTRLYSFVFTPENPKIILEITDEDTVLQGMEP
jgi:hypothetical protein